MGCTGDFAPPRIGDRVARKCRTHWHVGVAWYDEDEGESGYYETHGAPLTLAVAAWSSVRAGRDVERAERGEW